ncbi:lysM domain receptor-like kinase 3 [Mangifera indica]|uniref:lysM domain receptor-like kinase 3 n=1 Tax=Mangifera indica TaxID=29780 RepID=UPI001CFB407D|nr:lysM domain receptor-like kinase 3 [Mangifera indica]
MTSKTDVFAFGVVLAELVTGQRALTRDKKEPNKLKSLILVINTVFRHQNSEAALEAEIDPNLRGNYPMEQVYKMAELSKNCFSEEAAERPEMREIVQTLSQILTPSIEWQASLRETSQVFTGLFNGKW